MYFTHICKFLSRMVTPTAAVGSWEAVGNSASEALVVTMRLLMPADTFGRRLNLSRSCHHQNEILFFLSIECTVPRQISHE